MVLTKEHQLIKFKENALLKPYTDMNSELRTKAKNYFEKDLLKLMNDSVFWKVIENVIKHRNNKFVKTKLVKTKARRNYLVSKPNYHTTIFFSENVLAIEMKRTRIFINKHVYLALVILEIVMHDFWYDYVGPKYG